MEVLNLRGALSYEMAQLGGCAIWMTNDLTFTSRGEQGERSAHRAEISPDQAICTIQRPLESRSGLDVLETGRVS